MVDIERRCMSIILLSIGLFALVSCQMFDRKPTVYDHMKSGANTVKTNLVESELKIETEVGNKIGIVSVTGSGSLDTS